MRFLFLENNEFYLNVDPIEKKRENEINDKNQKRKMNYILPLKYSIIPNY